MGAARCALLPPPLLLTPPSPDTPPLVLALSPTLPGCLGARCQPPDTRGRLARKTTTREARPTFTRALIWPLGTPTYRRCPAQVGRLLLDRSLAGVLPTAAATSGGPSQSEPVAFCCPSKGPNPEPSEI